MSFTPMSKESMQKLKAEEYEKNRNKQIKEIVSNIYNNAIETAKNKTNKSYSYYINNRLLVGFIIKNHKEIIETLQKLFPDSSISTCIGGKTKISKCNNDNNCGPFPCILIDWS